MSYKFMLDTNIFDLLLKGEVVLNQLSEEYETFVTHIQKDEIDAINPKNAFESPLESKTRRNCYVMKGLICSAYLNTFHKLILSMPCTYTDFHFLKAVQTHFPG